MEKIILFSNYPNPYAFEQKRKQLFETYGDINDYDNESDVPDHFIKSELDYENEVNYNNFIYQIQEIFKTTAFTVFGTCDTLFGYCSGYINIATFEEFERLIENCKHIKITLEEDKLVIQCKHNQGTNYYNLRQLTPNGYETAKKNNFKMRKDYSQLFNADYNSQCPNIKKYDEEIY